MSTPPPDQILFRCHACRQKYAVEPARIGTRTHCKKCQVVMQVPKENALDRPEASKPTVHVTQAKVAPLPGNESVAELSFDDVDPKADESLVVDEPAASAIRHEHENDPPSGIVEPPKADDKKDLFDAAPAAADSGAGDSGTEGARKPEAKAPPGKKLCPDCGHACPSMAMSCPLCQHRFELPKPKPKPTADTKASESGIGTKSADKNAGKSGPALSIKTSGKDLGKKLDNAITERKKNEGRPVEPPMWMDENVYGIAFKMGFAGLCCLCAGIIVFIQLDSPESARHAFFLIKWAYAVGGGIGHIVGRLLPTLLCLAGGAAFLFFAIKPVVLHLKREKAIQLTDQLNKEAHAESFPKQ